MLLNTFVHDAGSTKHDAQVEAKQWVTDYPGDIAVEAAYQAVRGLIRRYREEGAGFDAIMGEAPDSMYGVTSVEVVPGSGVFTIKYGMQLVKGVTVTVELMDNPYSLLEQKSGFEFYAMLAKRLTITIGKRSLVFTDRHVMILSKKVLGARPDALVHAFGKGLMYSPLDCIEKGSLSGAEYQAVNIARSFIMMATRSGPLRYRVPVLRGRRRSLWEDHSVLRFLGGMYVNYWGYSYSYAATKWENFQESLSNVAIVTGLEGTTLPPKVVHMDFIGFEEVFRA